MARFERRINTEIEGLSKPENQIDNLKIVPSKTNNRLLDVYINGPEGTPYHGGQYHLQFFVGERYPMEAPYCYFVTKIWHPNVDYLGRICLDVLADKWSPALQIHTVALSILLLLQSPNASDPLDQNIADQFQQDPKAAELKAKKWAQLYAPVKLRF